MSARNVSSGLTPREKMQLRSSALARAAQLDVESLRTLCVLDAASEIVCAWSGFAGGNLQPRDARWLLAARTYTCAELRKAAEFLLAKEGK